MTTTSHATPAQLEQFIRRVGILDAERMFPHRLSEDAWGPDPMQMLNAGLNLTHWRRRSIEGQPEATAFVFFPDPEAEGLTGQDVIIVCDRAGSPEWWAQWENYVLAPGSKVTFIELEDLATA